MSSCCPSVCVCVLTEAFCELLIAVDFQLKSRPVRAPWRNAPLIRFLISALCILFACLYRMLPHLFFLHLFPTYLSLTNLFL